jgi:branched-chain amino acid transport system substrate-binding protein
MTDNRSHVSKGYRVSVALVAAAMAVMALAGCGGSGGAKGATTIKICTELPVSGADTSAGKPAENGAALAIKQANDNKTIPGYTFVHVPFDDVGAGGTHDPATGANNIRSVASDALVAGCVGPFNSSVAKAEMPIANNAGLALISPSNTNETLTKPEYGQLGTLRPTGKVTYFRVSTTDDLQGPAGADYFFKNANVTKVVTKVYIIDDTETYGKGIADNFAKQFQKDGGTVVGHKGLDKSTKDFKPAIAEAVQLGAQGIYYGGTDANGGTLCRVQIVTVPGADKLLYGGGDGLETDSFRTTTKQANAVGAVVTVASVNVDKLQSAANFKAAFTKQFPDPAAYGAYSANAYDAANILIQSIKKALDGGAVTPKDGGDSDGANTLRAAMIEQIAKIDYNGVTGHTTFDQNGDTTNKVLSIYKSGATGWDFVLLSNKVCH